MHGANRDPWQGLRGNSLLQSLSASDALALSPHLRRLRLRAGEHLADDAADAALIYFPETLVACLGTKTDRGVTFEIGMVGREGIIGWDVLFGPSSPRHCAKVQLTGGAALTISARRLRTICASRPTLAQAFLRFGHVFGIQMAGTLVSNLHDDHVRRLCRWLLMFHDRVDGEELAITHDSLATLLDARRATVTDALHTLEGDRLLRCTRGRIVVRDRAALELHAGHAYGASESAYRSAIGSFGRSA